MRSRAIKGALYNFLETYTSRYSDYDGYWLFGMLIGELEQFNIDLLGTGCETSDSTPKTAAVQLATAKFKDQLEKAGLCLSHIRVAQLVISRLPDFRYGYVNGHRRAGFDVIFVARTVSPHGKTYECKKSVFVAPHDPKGKQRSALGSYQRHEPDSQ